MEIYGDERTNPWERSLSPNVAYRIKRIRTAAEEKVRIASYLLSEKVRIASEQAKAQIPKAITWAKLGMTKEAIDLYLSIPEEVWTPDNIPLWNDRNDLLQALKPYVQQHKNNAKSLEAKGQYKEALNEYAEGLKVADDTEAKEIRKAALEIIRRNPALSEITEDARKYAVRGDVLLKEGNFEQAAKEYRKAINISPFTASFVNGQVKTDPSGIKLKCMGTVFQKRLKEIKNSFLIRKGEKRFRQIAQNRLLRARTMFDMD